MTLEEFKARLLEMAEQVRKRNADPGFTAKLEAMRVGLEAEAQKDEERRALERDIRRHWSEREPREDE